MLTRVRIEGFKAIHNSGTVRLSPLTLFIGRNGSGKSSFLEALQWIQESLATNLEDATADRFGDFDDLCNRRTRQISLHLAFKGTRGVNYDLVVRHGSQRHHEPVVQSESCREGKAPGRETIRTLQEGRSDPVRSIRLGRRVDNPLKLALAASTKSHAPGAVQLLEYLSNAVFLRLNPTAISTPVRLTRHASKPVLDESGKKLAVLLSSLTDKQRKWISGQLAKVVPGVKSLELVDNNNELGTFGTMERIRTRDGKIRAYGIMARLLSEGMRRLTAIFALLALRPRPPLIAIEEIENGLDPWTLRLVFNHLQDAADDGVQILLTTHSPFLIDHVKLEQIVYVAREHDGATYSHLTDYKLVMEHAGIVAPGAMYLAGYTKGSPTKGSNIRRGSRNEQE